MLRAAHWPFSRKLMITYLLIVMLAVCAVGFFAYMITVRAIQEKISSSMQGTLEQMGDNIAGKLSDLHRISGRLYYDYTLQKLLREAEDGWSAYEAATKYVMPTLDNVLHYTNSNILLTIYLTNEQFPEIYSTNETGADPLLRFKNVDVFHQARIEQESWYRALNFDRKRNEGVIWRQVGDDERFDHISLLRTMEDIRQSQAIGLIRVTIKLSELLDAVHYSKLGGAGYAAVVDGAGRTLHRSSAGDASEEDEKLALRVTEDIPGTDWRVEAALPRSVFREHARQVRNVTLLVCLISFFVLSGISVLVSRYFAGRVDRIVAVLHAFQDGDFHKRIRLRGRDEFAQIAEALNQLGQHMHELIEQVYVTKLMKKEAELASLQAQINPHFLYNTLSSISRLAKLGEIDKLHRMVLGLARFYRLSLNEGRTIITIRQELEQIQTYIDIQRIKYGNRMQVACEIDPAAAPYETVKLILQPFIENALEHAWHADRIMIRVSVRLVDQRIEFRIADDGIGISEETLRDIFTKDGMRRGYGIRNVDERIKLQYGEEFGVMLTSRPGAGTEVRIRIPAQRA